MSANVSFFAELKRRNVIRVAIAYAAVSWLILQAGALVFQALDLPNTLLKGLLALLVIGFIPTLVFSWVYEMTPEGLKRERDIARDDSVTHLTGRKLDFIVIGVLAAVVALLLVDKLVLAPRLSVRAATNAAAAAKVGASPAPASTTAAPAAASAAPPTAVAAPAAASIAVLPFVDMSQAKDQEYFSDGISEELLNLLAKIPQLHVAARTSSFSFKGKNAEIPEIAKQLLVAHVLEGSVRKAGDTIRVTAQLIRAADGYHLWSETYDRKLDDIFKIQDEIAAKVVGELKVTLLGDRPKTRETKPEAYALYLQAKQSSRQLNPDALAKSDELLHRALAIDPGYAVALNSLAANALNESMALETISEAEGLRRALDYIRQALAIDPELPTAHALLGNIAVRKNDLAAAARHFEQALMLDPANQNTRMNSTFLLKRLGRLQEAVDVLKDVVQHDPMNPTFHNNLCGYLRLLGRYDEALAETRTLAMLAPSRRGTHAMVAELLLLNGNAQAALAELDQETAESSRLSLLPIVYHALGRKADADAALDSLIAKYQDDSYQSTIASIYAYRGDADKAFAWLGKALEEHDNYVYEIGPEPYFDNVRSDPRWLPFLRKLGIAPEQLARVEFKVRSKPG